MSSLCTFTRAQWLSLVAAMAGWTLDAMDWMMLALALPLIKTSFGLSLPQLGLLATATLSGAAVGGILSGVLADLYGRIRILTGTMLWYSAFTAVCGFAHSYDQLLVLRVLTGLGLGGEWAVGATLVAEYWPDQYRGKANSFAHSGWPLGYGLAALAYVYMAPQWGWQGLFWLGSAPAIAAVLIRLSVKEPEVWRESRCGDADSPLAHSKFPMSALFGKSLLRRTILATVMTTGMLMAYWGSATWLPSFLAGTHGLNVVKTGSFLIVLNLGAFVGYQFFGWVADRYGRHSAFIFGLSGAVITTGLYVLAPNEKTLFYFGPVFGFFTYGLFGPIGAYISELFPTVVRATGNAFVFNVGRGVSMLSPLIIGSIGESVGMAWGLGTTLLFNLIALLALWFLPETTVGKKAHDNIVDI